MAMVANGRGPRYHINRRIGHSGSKVQDKRDSRNPGLYDPRAHVVLWASEMVQSISPMAMVKTLYMCVRIYTYIYIYIAY